MTQSKLPTNEAQVLPESPVSATVKLRGQHGADILFTVRAGATADEARATLDVLAQAMAYAKQAYNLTPKSGGNPPNGSNGNGSNGVPVCRYHGEMKPSKHGGFYCPAKLQDGSGYCKETA